MHIKIVYLILLIILNFSCTNNSSKEIKVGVLMPRGDSFFYERIRAHFGGMILYDNIDLVLKNADGSADLQLSQVDELIAQGVKVLIIGVLRRDDCASIIRKAKKAKVPIIFFRKEPYESDMLLWNKAYYVGTQDRVAGSIVAEIVANHFSLYKELDRNRDGIIQYVAIEGEEDSKGTWLRSLAFENYFKTNKRWKVEQIDSRYCNLSYNMAYAAMAKMFETHGDEIEAVFTHGDEMALAAMNLLERRGYFVEGGPFVPIVGMDGIPEAIDAIAEGKIIGSAFYNYKTLVKILIEMTLTLGNDKEASSTIINFTSEDGTMKGNYGYVLYQKVIQSNFAKF